MDNEIDSEMDEELFEELNNVKEELKRVDHLIFVSLKYTRTVDVLKNVVNRLMNSFGFMISVLLIKAKLDGKIEKVPTAPIEMANLAKTLYKDEKYLTIINRFLLLRRISKVEDYESENEYRRYVRMRIFLEIGDNIEEFSIEIDTVGEYYVEVQELLSYLLENIQ